MFVSAVFGSMASTRLASAIISSRAPLLTVASLPLLPFVSRASRVIVPASAAAVSLPVPVTAPMIGMSFPIHAFLKVQEAGAQGLAYQAVQPGYAAWPFL